MCVSHRFTVQCDAAFPNEVLKKLKSELHHETMRSSSLHDNWSIATELNQSSTLIEISADNYVHSWCHETPRNKLAKWTCFVVHQCLETAACTCIFKVPMAGLCVDCVPAGTTNAPKRSPTASVRKLPVTILLNTSSA